MTTFYDHNQILDLPRHGSTAETSGVYALWIWAQEGCRVRATFSGRTFPPTHTRNRPGLFTWAKAGQVDLKKGRRIRIELKVDNAGDPSPVGAIALSEWLSQD